MLYSIHTLHNYNSNINIDVIHIIWFEDCSLGLGLQPGIRRAAKCSVGGAVQEHKVYEMYRQLIEELGNRPGDRWLTDLHTLLQRFASEATMLEPGSAHLLCEELADQLEQEALYATTTLGRNVLLGAVKGFDAMSFPLTQQ